MTTVIITSGTTYNVPSDCNGGQVDCIGGGGGGGDGGATFCGSGGGGGAFSRTNSVSLTPSATIDIAVGAGGAVGAGAAHGTAGGDTWFNGASLGASSCGAKGGGAGSPTRPRRAAAALKARVSVTLSIQAAMVLRGPALRAAAAALRHRMREMAATHLRRRGAPFRAARRAGRSAMPGTTALNTRRMAQARAEAGPIPGRATVEPAAITAVRAAAPSRLARIRARARPG